MILQNILPRIKQFFRKKSTIFPIVIAGLAIVFFALFLFISNILNPSLNTQNLSDYSKIISGRDTKYFIIQKDDGYIYKSNKTGLDAVKDFINKNPSFNGTKLLPSDFAKNSDLIRSEKDSIDPFLKNNNINISNEHYFLEQKINGIPIYGSFLVVHLKNNSEIYSISGNIVNAKNTTSQKITEDQARKIALNDAFKESSEIKEFRISNIKKYIINKKILGISDDKTSHLALGLQIDSSETPPTFSTMYFISLSDGEILYKVSNILDALNRKIHNCNGSTSCPLSRGEGSPPTGIADVDRAYDIYGEVYNYYFNNFQRDGPDDQGSPLNAYVNAPSSVVGATCPNASANWTTLTMSFCPRMVARDVIGHELTHTLTGNTAGLEYKNQSGALNESISDIFGSAIDNNWTIGEESVKGIIRDMINPPSRGQPDRLFSSLYYCTGSPSNCNNQNDKCGVHSNSGVMNKAFYLMTDGGSFNGCSITGIGRSKSSAVVYQALTKYLTSTSNFKSMYNSLLQACNDLYSSGSSDCENVKNALQATEMDQQPDGSQTGAYCQNIPRQTPACAGGSSLPTTPVSPTVTLAPGISPTVVPTNTPKGFNISVQVWTDVNNSGSVFDNGDVPYQGATVILTGPVNTSGVTNSLGILVFPNLPPGVYQVRITNVASFIINPITITVTNFDIPVVLPLPPISSTTPPVIVTQPVTPVPTSILVPTPIPTGVSSSISPTPTPIVTFNCVIDSKCASGQKNLQFCPLICTPK